MRGSGYRTPPALVRRADGQIIQLTRLLYLVLAAVDGRRTHAEIAAERQRPLRPDRLGRERRHARAAAAAARSACCASPTAPSRR